MSEVFQGAALFSAEEIKVALGNYKLAKKNLPCEYNEYMSEYFEYFNKHVMKDYKNKSCYAYFKPKADFLNRYFCYYVDTMGEFYEKKLGRYKNTYNDVRSLSSNGTRPAYLNPDQAAFVNEWGGDKNEQTTKTNT